MVSRSKEEAMQERIKMENPTIFLLRETKKQDRDMQKIAGNSRKEASFNSIKFPRGISKDQNLELVGVKQAQHWIFK